MRKQGCLFAPVNVCDSLSGLDSSESARTHGLRNGSWRACPRFRAALQVEIDVEVAKLATVRGVNLSTLHPVCVLVRTHSLVSCTRRAHHGARPVAERTVAQPRCSCRQLPTWTRSCAQLEVQAASGVHS